MNLHNARLIVKPVVSVCFGESVRAKGNGAEHLSTKKDSQKGGELQGKKLSSKEISEGMSHDYVETPTATLKVEREREVKVIPRFHTA